MKDDLDLTCWRGVYIRHPAEWELMQANQADQPGWCLFADRIYQRLDVRWRPVKYVPNLELLLDKYRQHKDREPAPYQLPVPDPWQALGRDTDQGQLTHAFRFFSDAKLLVETTIIWPEGRNEQVEHEILAGMDTQPAETATNRFQAMGISMGIPARYELTETTSTVGHIKWHFTEAGRDRPGVTIERIAMPEYWLSGSIGDWQASDITEKTRVIDRRVVNCNGHNGQQIITSEKIGPVSSLRGLRLIKLDRAWLCPAENRVYRLVISARSATEEISLPEGLAVRCCRPVPLVKLTRAL